MQFEYTHYTVVNIVTEFENAQCLYISEVRIILEAQEDSKENGTVNRPSTK